MEQLDAALDCGVETIYADFEDIRRDKDAVALVRAAPRPQTAPPAILLATPRIQKAGEKGFFKLIESAEPDGVLIRNLGAIRYFAERAASRAESAISRSTSPTRSPRSSSWTTGSSA